MGLTKVTYSMIDGAVINVLDFGAIGDGSTDDTAAIQAAVDFGRNTIFLPAGIYLISDAITIDHPVVFVGAGPDITYIIQSSSTADALTFDYATFERGGGVRDISIHAGSKNNTGEGSSGTGVYVNEIDGNFLIDNIEIRSFATGVNFKRAWYCRLENFQIVNFTTHGVYRQATTTTGGVTIFNGKISNNGFTGNNSASTGIYVEQTGGDFYDTVDCTSCHNGVVLKPTAGVFVLYLFMKAVLGDTCTNVGFMIDGSVSSVKNCAFVDCWAGYNDGNGIEIIGSNVDALQFIGGRFRENGKNGVYINGGTNILFDGSYIAQNSKNVTETYDGARLTNVASSVKFTNVRSGNFGSGLSTKQKNNISIDTGHTGNVQIIGCDLSDAGATGFPFINYSTAYVMLSGNLPLQNGCNYPVAETFNFSSNSAIAAGATKYIGINGDSSTDDSPFITCMNGSIVKTKISSVTAPGAGQTFTYTVMKNFVATTMTGTISGTDTSLILTGNITVNEGDSVSIKVVTSAGAASSNHRGFSVIGA